MTCFFKKSIIMKKITLLSSFLAISLFSFAQTTVLTDFSSNSVGDSYPIFSLYANAVTTTRGTATVAADPAGANGNSVKVIPTSGNHLVQFTITIPTGKTLANYDNFYFDLYPTNVLADGTAGTGARYSTALVQIGSSCTPGASGATALLYETATVDKGSSNTWHTITIPLSTITGLSAYSGSQSLFIGLYSDVSTIYYLDNIKIHSTVAGITQSNISDALVIFTEGNTFKLNRIVDKAELFNLNGSKIATVTNSNVIPVLNLNNGIYIVKSVVDNVSYVSKVIK